MARVKTGQLKEGMVVAAEVTNMDNVLLLPAGCHLSEKHIEILQAWGIPEIQVQSTEGLEASGDPLARLTPEEVQRLTEETRALFYQLNDKEPAHLEVFNFILRRRARRIPHA
jgi:hypothetical protein